jgi:outer membrane scaffolding protein for murein synthesis (MipA/OmpV family)
MRDASQGERLRRAMRAALLGLAMAPLIPTPAPARELAPDRIAVAAGVVMAPDYEGSDDYVPTLGTGALIRLRGHAITFRGDSLSLDLVPEYRDQNSKIVAGPMIGLNFDRAGAPRDPVVALTRRRKTAVEGGGFVGFTKSGVLTSPYDNISATLAASYDLGKVHRSFIVTPSVDYTMPLSRGVVVEASLSADVVGGRYARTYFGVGRTSSAVSGLPRYEPHGGLKSVSLGLGGAIALNGDLDRRGVLIGAMLNYERLLGQFAASPLVARRGSPNQASLAIGAGYHF